MYASQDLITIQQMAERGDAAVQDNLGVSYYLGKSVALDDKQAVAWIHKAAEHRREACENALAMKEDLIGFFSGDTQ